LLNTSKASLKAVGGRHLLRCTTAGLWCQEGKPSQATALQILLAGPFLGHNLLFTTKEILQLKHTPQGALPCLR